MNSRASDRTNEGPAVHRAPLGVGEAILLRRGGVDVDVFLDVDCPANTEEVVMMAARELAARAADPLYGLLATCHHATDPDGIACDCSRAARWNGVATGRGRFDGLG